MILLWYDYLDSGTEKELYKTQQIRVKKHFRKYKNSVVKCFITNPKTKEKLVANVNVESLSVPINIDCFNCTTGCCGDLPGKLDKKSIDYINSNSDRFEEKTKIKAIQKELNIDESIDLYEVGQDTKNLGNFSIGCPIAYINENGNKVCALHSMCLEDGISQLSYKPIICNIYPILAFYDTETNEVFITLHSRETSDIFGIYMPCSNYNDRNNISFKRDYPNFSDNWRKVSEVYKDEIIYTFGEEFYNEIVKLGI